MTVNTRDAIEWDKEQVCLEEALVIDNAKVKKQKLMISFYTHFNKIWLTMVFIICAFSTYMITISNGILSIAVCAFVIVASLIAIPFVCAPKWMLNDKIKEEKEANVFTDDFFFFARNVRPATKFNYSNQDFFVLNPERFNAHMMYKLFVLVDTYAMESFIAAATNEDYSAMRRLLDPFIDKILEDTKKAYQTHLELEETVEDRRKADLNAQIDLDLAIFEKRIK